MYSIDKKLLTSALLAFVVTILVYIPALENGFVNWDDPAYIYNNRHIRSLDAEFLEWAFTSFHTSYWHPLTWLTHASDHALWGLNPVGHHLTSVIIHGSNAALVVLTAALLLSFADRRRVGNKNMASERAVVLAGGITGLFFGIHPLHVESVVWISERKDVLCGFFFLLSIFYYLRYAGSLPENKDKGNRRSLYYFALVSFMLALMSKPMAVTLPVILVLLDIYPLERLELKKSFGEHRGVLMEKIPFIVLSVAASVLTIIAQHEVGAVMSVERYTFIERLWIAVNALALYLVRMVYPANLAPLYPHPEDIAVFSLEYSGSFLLLSVITLLCIRSWKRSKLWSVLWAYYIVTLLPVLGIIQVGEQAAADRYTYLPSLAPTLLAGIVTFRIWKNGQYDENRRSLKKGIAAAVLIMVTAGFTTVTYTQIKVWEDSFTLWNRELELYDSAIAYNNRGEAYSAAGEYQKAIADFNKAAGLQPEDPSIYYNRGSAYKKTGKYNEAMADLDRAIELDPAYAPAYNNRGNLFLILGKYQRAMADLDRAVELDPEYALAYNNRGNIFLRAGLYDKALADFGRTIELDPLYAPAYYNRGNVYLNLKMYDRAIADYTRTVEIDPEYAEAYNNRGNIYLRLGEYQKAASDCTKAVELDPAYAFAYYNRALAYREMGDMERANADLRQAARLGNKMAQAYLASMGLDY